MRTLIASVLLSAVLLLGAAAVPAGDTAKGYKIVVHRDNRVAAISRTELTQLFLKKKGQWADGTPVSPVDRDPDAAVRARFSSDVLHKDVATIKSYWERQLFTGHATPPPVLRSDREVLAFVANARGAVGYVAPDTQLPDGVRSVDVSE